MKLILLGIYLVGYVISTSFLLKLRSNAGFEITFGEVVASGLVAIPWPIIMPVIIILIRNIPL